MDDANDFLWIWGKASHAVLLCQMEQGEVKSYSDTLAIDRNSGANAQKHVTVSQTSSPQNLVYGKNMAKQQNRCLAHIFNQGTCPQKKSHETKGVLYKCICASCFASAGKTFTHAEVECKNKHKGQAKNEQVWKSASVVSRDNNPIVHSCIRGNSTLSPCNVDNPQSAFLSNLFVLNAMYQALQVIRKGPVLNAITLSKGSPICKSRLLLYVINAKYCNLLKILILNSICLTNMAILWKYNWKAIKTKLGKKWVKRHVTMLHLV